MSLALEQDAAGQGIDGAAGGGRAGDVGVGVVRQGGDFNGSRTSLADEGRPALGR